MVVDPPSLFRLLSGDRFLLYGFFLREAVIEKNSTEISSPYSWGGGFSDAAFFWFVCSPKNELVAFGWESYLPSFRLVIGMLWTFTANFFCLPILFLQPPFGTVPPTFFSSTSFFLQGPPLIDKFSCIRSCPPRRTTVFPFPPPFRLLPSPVEVSFRPWHSWSPRRNLLALPTEQ